MLPTWFNFVQVRTLSCSLVALAPRSSGCARSFKRQKRSKRAVQSVRAVRTAIIRSPDDSFKVLQLMRYHSLVWWNPFDAIAYHSGYHSPGLPRAAHRHFALDSFSSSYLILFLNEFKFHIPNSFAASQSEIHLLIGLQIRAILAASFWTLVRQAAYPRSVMPNGCCLLFGVVWNVVWSLKSESQSESTSSWPLAQHPNRRNQPREWFKLQIQFKPG